MLTYRLNNCEEYSSIPSLIDKIDCKLTEYAKKYYNNIIYALNNNIDSTVMLDLLNYKRILQFKKCNADYASCYSVESIAGKVKILTFK